MANLKTIIQTSSETANQLKKVVPVFQNIIVLMSQITDIWGSADLSLQRVEQQISLWYAHSDLASNS